ncbi:exonuclease domain-containing protein [Bacillus sp. PS06]|uniref:exonuclease domain-containing protein n=1 Tax=Bacillus sp. PS06 TaxID=2764176 RepID=UPI00177C965D|nr:exonuclease domain-containing protein [Bacillus sp. PS06]MBD8071512.1 3'-5' exoribonuclease [Bacillus sp. PS06]
MGINNMVQFVKQLSGRMTPNMYASVASRTDAASIAYLRQLQRELKREDVLDVPFSELKVVVFDLETTGFDPYKGDRILSIGAVKVQGGKMCEGETYYSLIQFNGEISEEISHLTGITKEALMDAPPVEVVLKEFYEFVNGDTLIAHHANHERKFMDHITWSIMRRNFQHRIIDTSFLTKIVEPEKNLISLSECCAHFDIQIEQRHHALHDAIATAQLWTKNLTAIQALGFGNLKEVYAHLATNRR